ncbi:ribose import ATP-binding protein RbsA [Bacteroidia bacterium]|nr:ribose import ATP-binding protein RbsA [Bacteroidia bacterium]
MMDIILNVENVSKRFGATQALKDVSFTIRKGTIHSLLGRNGAGKSTVVNIIAGIYKQNSGSVTLEGQDVTSYSVFERQNMGIKIVPQHASIVPELTVGENVFMGIWPKKNGFVDWKVLYEEAKKELDRYGLNVDPRKKVRLLNAVDQRKVNIVRAMHGGAKVIILDEPTTALSSVERAELFVFVNELKAKGTSFIFISHYLQEVVELSDDVTVIRDGCSFPGMEEAGLREEKLAQLIAGEEVELNDREKLPTNSEKGLFLECQHISGPILKDVSVKLYEGEITGIVGFPGSGAREFCRTLFGLEKMQAGTLKIKGEKSISIKMPSTAMKNGISYVSNDRHKEGIVGLMTIEENISLPLLYTSLKNKFGFVNRNKSKKLAKYFFEIFHVKANSTEDKLSSLSGGNQQKVVVAKSVGNEPKLLILDEPTIGIDIKSREEIIENINKITEESQTSVLYLTNDFDELIRAVDRILFFKDGRLIKDVRNISLTHEDVIKMRDSLDEALA